MFYVLRSHYVYDFTNIWGDVGDGGGGTGEKAAEPVPAVQECVSTILKYETTGYL